METVIFLLCFVATMTLASCVCSVLVYLMNGDLRHSVEDIKAYLIYSRDRGADPEAYRDFFAPAGPAKAGDVKLHLPDSLINLYKGNDEE